jgi:transposase InsO family protein
MPWKETDKMDQRIEFAMRALRTENFRELCREYGISAKTGYKWRERLLRDGWAGMVEESRRPHSHAGQLGEEVVCEMVRLKQGHPHWGPRKIQELYRRRHGGEAPSESSFKRILERAGMTTPRRLRRAERGGRLAQGRKAEKPNDIWTVDFKGWWKDPEGLRVEPLTVRDENSRMLLEMRLMADCRGPTVRRCFEELFERHGMPGAIRSDNGAPFASTRGLMGLTQLSAWWLALGIDLERNRPGCPQDNGGHERMHRDIRCELEGGRIGRDQSAFDQWRQEYNTERPHEALGMKTPAEIYEPSPRPYQGMPEDLDYGGSDKRKVHRRSGLIRYGAGRFFISTAIGGWSVGMKPQKNGLVEVWFSRLLLGHIDPAAASFLAIRTDGQEAGQPEEK